MDLLRMEHAKRTAVILALLIAASGCSTGSEPLENVEPQPSDDDSVSSPPAESPTLSFSANSEQVQSGDSVTLTWTTTGADSCMAEGGWNGSRDTSGNESVGPLLSDSAFTLACSGEGGSVSKTVTIAVSSAPTTDAPTLSFSASSQQVQPGESVILSWDATNALSCGAGGDWSGDKDTAGSETVGPLEEDSSFSLTCNGDGGSVSRTVTVAVNAPLPGNAVASFKLVDDGSGAGRPVSFGLPLADGAVPPGSSLVVTREDGSVLASQWNELVSWRTSDSPLHGVMTFETPDAADNSATYFVKVGTDHSGPAITRSDVVAGGFDAEVAVRIAGVEYRLRAADLLSGAISSRQDYTHYAGPLSAEFVVGAPLRENGSGAEHETLQAYFYIRAFQRPVARAYVTIVLENTGAFNALSDINTENVDITVDGISLPGFPKSSFTVFADVRYQKRTWWNGDPQLWVAHDVEEVQDTKLVPEYRNIEIDESRLAAFPQATDWNERNILGGVDLDSGGAKPELAPYDRWTAAYLISGDRRAWNAMRTAQDEYAAVVRSDGDAVSRPRDEETGLPVDLAVKGVISDEWGDIGNENTLLANRDGIAIAKTDLAHQPAIGYVTYLLTGESNELESLLFSGVNAWLNERPGGYPGVIPNRRWGPAAQVRSLAWGFREVLNAGTVTPDGHPLRSTMELAVTNALHEMSSRGQPLDPSGTLGIWLTGPGYGVAVIYSDSETPNPNDAGSATGYAPWQDDWLTWSIGAAYERGWKDELETSGLWAWKAQSVVSRFGISVSGFCWDYAANYALGIQDTRDGPFYSSWPQIFSKNFPDVGECRTAGAAMSKTDGSATSYGAQIGPALAVAASTDVTGAADAWQLYDQRDRTHWGSGGFTVAPEWAITVR